MSTVSIAEESEEDAASSVHPPVHPHPPFQARGTPARARSSTGLQVTPNEESPNSHHQQDEQQIQVMHPLAGGESHRPMPTFELGSGIAGGDAGTDGASSANHRHDFQTNPHLGGSPYQHASPVPPAAAGPVPSMFNLLGILNNYRMRIHSGTLDQLFEKINLDERSWNLLMRSQLPKSDLSPGLEQLLETVTEFVKRLNRKSSTKVRTILDNVMYTEEVNFAYRVYSRSNTLFGQIFRYLKPLFAEMETYMESERGQLPSLNLKAMYNEVKDDLEEMYERQEQQARAEEKERQEAEAAAASKTNSKSGSPNGSKRSSMSGSAANSTMDQMKASASSSASASTRPSFSIVGSTRAQKSRNSSRRGSLKDEARKKAAIAAALATSAALAARREEELAATAAAAAGTTTPASSSPQADAPNKAGTASNSRSNSIHASYPQSSRRDSEQEPTTTPGGEQIKITVNGGANGQTHTSSHRPSTLLAASSSSPISDDSSSPPPLSTGAAGVGAAGATSAAALAAQALAAAADAAAAAERVAAMDDPNDSEEDDLSSSLDGLSGSGAGGGGAPDDIFSRLLASSSTHSYPLPPRLRKKPLSKPHPEFLASYMQHHAKSFHLIESLLDGYLLCLMCALVALALTETLQKKDLYALILSEANTLASHFVRFGLPLVDRLLSVEPKFLRENLMSLSFHQVERGIAYADARQCIRKCRLLHAMFAGLDIYVFPRAVHAHKHGTKCISPSHLSRSEFVATAGYDQAIRIWDLKRNKCLAQFIGHTSIVTWCAFASADTWLASASFDGTIKIWNARTGECLRTLAGHTDAILDADLGSKDKYLVSGGMDCSVRLWSTTTGKCLRIYTGHRHWVKSVRFACDDQTILSAGLDKRIFVWNLRSGAGGAAGPRHTLVHANYILDLLVVHPHRFLSTSKDQTIRAWDPRTGKADFDLANPNGSTALTLALSPDGRLIAAGFFDHTINVYDAIDNCQLKRQIKVHNDGILCVRWTDNRTIVVGTSTGDVQTLHI